MQVGVIISSLLLISSFSSGEKAFKRLDKKYEADKVKCLKLAKKMVSKDRKKPVPYFFMSQIYFDEYKAATKTSTQHRNLNRALSNLYKIQKLSYKEMYGLERVELLKTEILNEVPTFEETLIAKNEMEKLSSIQTRASRLKGYVKPEHKAKKEEVDNSFVKIRDHHYGLPSGSEIIKSANAQSEKELMDIINQNRIAKGMSILVWDENLARAARYHACDMATEQYFDHTSYDRINDDLVAVGGAFERIRKFYTTGFVNSENLAAGRKEPINTYRQWDTSPGHHRNMFNSKSTKVGIGFYMKEGSPDTYYWAFCTALN
jgi:uncharacterized protein YkwD